MVFNFERRPRVQPVTVKMVAEAPEVRASGIAGPQRIIYVHCPACQSHKALVVFMHYGETTCFCPGCEHAWDVPRRS